jgi:hypothetical protein
VVAGGTAATPSAGPGGRYTPAHQHPTWGGRVDWIRLVDIAVGALFGGGLVSTSRQLRHQRQVHKEDRRRQSSPTIIAVARLVEDSRPARCASRRVPSNAVIDPLLERQREVHDQLLALTIPHPSQKVRTFAYMLDRTIRRTIINTGAWIDLRQGEFSEGMEEARSIAEAEYAKAEQLLEKLIEAL